ncbi:hypothetical protein D1872_90180 [compost metagenome]
MRKTIDAEKLIEELEDLIRLYEVRGSKSDPERFAASISTVHTIMNKVNKLRGAK